MSAMPAMTSAQLARSRSMSNPMSTPKARAGNLDEFTMSPSKIPRHFEPTAATASMFLYAQGNSVVCCHHDTLTIERRFSRHSEDIQILAVDTQSEVGAGRFVVSYDAGQTAIVWDAMSGDEISRFSSYSPLTAAAWMRSGNVAFGNNQGNIILFEPATSEHLSERTLDQIAVTALAPSSDCRTFAIGYQNGSLLVATLQPRFTILHNLTTSRGPSPIVTLAWHASSSRQKSDMLAVQTNDGDLRVWSVSKAHNSADPAKVVRILKKSENYLPGPNWMGWSKNGRIIQFSESETLSWDVRTKHVTYDNIPTLDHIRGLAVYGPGASLFTLGANNTVQQFDLNAPAVMVANVQHPNLLPPSPPVSIEEQEKGAAGSTSESESIQISVDISESDDDRASPFARLVKGVEPVSDSDEPYRTASPASSRSEVSDVSRSSTSSRTPGQYAPSARSRGGLTEATYISAGSSIRSSAVPFKERREKDSFSISSLSSVSMGSSIHRSRHKPSRLRHEVPRSPQESRVTELFKFTRSRLSDVPYKMPPMMDTSRLTNDDLRRQMLITIFGWNKDVEDLIRDEMARHPTGSPSRILLAKWLGDIDADIMTASSENMTSSDWMLLALSGIGGQASQHKLGRAYVQRLLESGDIHAAAAIMIGMGDQVEAIEIYLAHKKFLEALILSCLFFPSVWERQSQIIKKWGEWAVQHGHQQLAIRCFACIGKESSEPWTSPSAAQVTFQSITPSIPEILSPPLSPPGLNRGPQRSIAKTSALKLITTFGDEAAKSKYFSTGDDGQTPIAAGVTPIAESAISPAAYDVTTAFIRPSQRSAFNTPSSARSNATTFSRGRLPSIGEMPHDGTPRPILRASGLPTPPVGSPAHSNLASDANLSVGLSLQRAATASPMMMKDSHRRKEALPPSPSPASMVALMEGRTSRNGARDRRPDGLGDLKLPSIDNAAASDMTSPEQSVTSSTRFHWPTRRRGPGSVASSLTSASTTSRRGHHQHQHGGKSLDDYIHSLDAAKGRARGSSLEGRHKARDHSRTRKTKSREPSEERGRPSGRAYTPGSGKRSPRSPVPMSPEDLLNLSTPRFSDPQVDGSQGREEASPPTVRKSTSAIRHTPKPRNPSRGPSRGPERRPTPVEIPRGRNNAREGSVVRSPSSPLPMSTNAQHFYGSEDEEDYKKAVEAQEVFRQKNNRSTATARERSSSRTRENVTEVPDNRKRTPAPREPSASEHVGDLKRMKDERQAKKEAAARELEERRKSLVRRPLAPSIPHPHEFSAAIPRPPSAFELPSTTFVPPHELPMRSQTADPERTRSMYAKQPTRPTIGLPATPKAMRLIIETDNSKGTVPSVPPIPATFAQAASPQSSRQTSPEKEEAPSGGLTLLPSTVYQPPSRPPPRSMSAPPEEYVPAQSLHGGATSRLQRGHSLRKLSTPDARDNRYTRTTDEAPEASRSSRRPSQDDQIPPPPPPPPPILKELQHLAIPPPPPPAPLPYTGGERPVVYSGKTSGMIEIVMDDDQVPVAQPASDANVPILAPPAPPLSRSHQRGRSSVDTTIAGRLSRTTDRMRSASRGRNSSSVVSRNKSPEGMAPYESIPPPVSFHNRHDSGAPAPYESIPPPQSFQSRPEIKSPIDQRHPDWPTGLGRNEMI